MSIFTSGYLDSTVEDRIWRLKFGKTQFWSCILKNKFESLYFWKASFHFLWGLVEAFKSGKLHFWKCNLFYGASVDVGRIHFFIWYVSGPGIQPKPSVFRRRRSIFSQCEAKIVRRHTSMVAVRCCVTTTLASETFWSTVKRVPKLRFEPVSFLFLVFL